MSMADDLEKLRNLRASGALTESEFDEAKRKVLDGVSDSVAATTADAQHASQGDGESARQNDESLEMLGRAATAYVETQRNSNRFGMIIGAIGLVIFLL